MKACSSEPSYPEATFLTSILNASVQQVVWLVMCHERSRTRHLGFCCGSLVAPLETVPSICYDPAVVKESFMKLMLLCGDKFEIDVHYSLFLRGGLVSFSDVGTSRAEAHVDPTVDLDSFLKINAFCDSAFVTMARERVMRLWRI